MLGPLEPVVCIVTQTLLRCSTSNLTGDSECAKIRHQCLMFARKMAQYFLEDRIMMSLHRSAGQVFLRKHFDKFGGYDQVGRVLRRLTAKGHLVKAGYGVYVKAKPSSLTGQPVPVLPLLDIGLAALTQLGVKPELGQSEQSYLDRQSTQMPMVNVLNVGKSRVTRRIGFGTKSIRYES